MKIATLVIIREANQVLLGVKGPAEIGTGILNAPGGKQEPGETTVGCAIRETKQEVRVQVTAGSLRHIGLLYCYVGNPVDCTLFQIVHVYYTTEFSGIPRQTKSMTPEWVPTNDLPYERMHEGDRYWFDLAVDGRSFHCKVWYKQPGKGYITHKLFVYD